MSHHGDILLGKTIDIKFTTVDSAGLPTTLAGSPVVSAYVGNGTTQITAGITLSVDFDGVTGLHNVRVVATEANGFAGFTDVSLVITTGTVDGASVVGYEIGSFSIANRFIISDIGTAQAGGPTSITLRAGAGGSGLQGRYVNHAIFIYGGTGEGQLKNITNYNGTTKVATVGAGWLVEPDVTSTYVIFPLGVDQASLYAYLNAGGLTLSTTERAAIADKILARNTAGGADSAPTVSTTLAQLPAAPVKNAAFTYVIKMVDSTDHATPETGLTITMTRSIDAAAFGAATGVITEISTGHYKVVASAADMNGDVVTHRFTASGADDLTMEWFPVS